MIQYIKEICITLVVCIAVILCTASNSNANISDTTGAGDVGKLTSQLQENVGLVKRTANGINLVNDENGLKIIEATNESYDDLALEMENDIDILLATYEDKIRQAIENATKKQGIILTDEQMSESIKQAKAAIKSVALPEGKAMLKRVIQEAGESLENCAQDVVTLANNNGLNVKEMTKKLIVNKISPKINSLIKEWIPDIPILGDALGNFLTSALVNLTGVGDKIGGWVEDFLWQYLPDSARQKIQYSKNNSTEDDSVGGTILSTQNRSTWRWESELAYSIVAATNTYVAGLVNNTLDKMNDEISELATKAGVSAEKGKSLANTLTGILKGSAALYLNDRMPIWTNTLKDVLGGETTAEDLMKIYNITRQTAEDWLKGNLSEEKMENIKNEHRKALHERYANLGKEALTAVANNIGAIAKDATYKLFDRLTGDLETLKERFGTIGGSAIKAIASQVKNKLGSQIETLVSKTLSSYWTLGGEELKNALSNIDGISLKFTKSDLWTFGADVISNVLGDENLGMLVGLAANVFKDGAKNALSNMQGITINSMPFVYDSKMALAVAAIQMNSPKSATKISNADATQQLQGAKIESETFNFDTDGSIVRNYDNGITETISADGTKSYTKANKSNAGGSSGQGYDDSYDMFLIRGGAHVTSVVGPSAYGAPGITGIGKTTWSPLHQAFVVTRYGKWVVTDHKVATEIFTLHKAKGLVDKAPVPALIAPPFYLSFSTLNNFIPMGYSYIRNGKPKNADSGYVMCEMNENQHSDSYVQRALSKTSIYSGTEYDQDEKSEALANEAMNYKNFAEEVDDRGGYENSLQDLTEEPKSVYDRNGEVYVFGPFKMDYIRDFSYDTSRGPVIGTDKVEFGLITDMDVYNQDGKVISKDHWTIIFDDETKMQRREHDEDYELPYPGEEFYIMMENFSDNDTQSISKINIKFNEMQINVKYSRLLSQYTWFFMNEVIIPVAPPDPRAPMYHQFFMTSYFIGMFPDAINVVSAVKQYEEYELDIELHRKETGTGGYDTAEYYTTSSTSLTGTTIISTANGRDMNSESMESLRELYYQYGIDGMITNGTAKYGKYANSTKKIGEGTADVFNPGKSFNEALRETVEINKQANGNKNTNMLSQTEAIAVLLGKSDSKIGKILGIATNLMDPNASVLSKVLAVASYFDKSGKLSNISNAVTSFNKITQIIENQNKGENTTNIGASNGLESPGWPSNESGTQKQNANSLLASLALSYLEIAASDGNFNTKSILSSIYDKSVENYLTDDQSKQIANLAKRVLNKEISLEDALKNISTTQGRDLLNHLITVGNNGGLDIISSLATVINSNGDIDWLDIAAVATGSKNSELVNELTNLTRSVAGIFGKDINSEKVRKIFTAGNIAYNVWNNSKATQTKYKSDTSGKKAEQLRNKSNTSIFSVPIPYVNAVANASETTDKTEKTFTDFFVEAYYKISEEPKDIVGNYISVVKKLELKDMPTLTAQISNSANIESLIECLDLYTQRLSQASKPERFADTEEANAILFDRTPYEQYSPKFTINSTSVPTQVYYSNDDEVGTPIGFAGNVWKDGHTGLENNYNGVRDSNAAGQLEMGIEGVKVSLIDRKTGQLAFRYRSSRNNKQMLPAIVYTDEGGYYVIERVPVGEYDVQFEYDGQTYKVMDDSALSGGNIQDYIENPNHEKYLFNSKAIEDPVERQEFNDRFYEIVPGNGWDTAYAVSKDAYNAQSDTYAYREVGNKVEGYNKKNIMRDDKTGLTDIAFTGEKTSDGRVKIKLGYNKDDGIATLITTDNRGRAKPEFAMHAKTSLVGLTYPPYDQFALGNQTISHVFQGNNMSFYDAGEYMYHINLGLIERSKIDVGITSDVYKVVTTVNQKEETYVYNARGNLGIYDSVLKQTQTYRNYKYTRELYKADYEFRVTDYKINRLNILDKYNNLTKNDAEGKNLFVDIQDAKLMTPTGQYIEEKEIEERIFITYKLAIKNQSILQSATVNEILDSFNYNGYNKGNVVNEDIKAWIQDEEGNLVYKTIAQQSYFERRYETRPLEQRKIRWENYSLYDKNQWEGVYTTGIKDEMLATNDVIYLYVTFELEREGNDGVELEDIDNYVEITNYSSFPNWAQNKYYSEGLIDKDSLPGNMTADLSVNDNEDDTDASPVLSLKLYEKGSNKNGRIINGYVWDDERDVTLETGQRIGNGLWDDGEEGEDVINGVRVQLVEKIKNPYYGTEYEYIWKEMKTNDQKFEAVKNGAGDAGRRRCRLF